LDEKRRMEEDMALRAKHIELDADAELEDVRQRARHSASFRVRISPMSSMVASCEEWLSTLCVRARRFELASRRRWQPRRRPHCC
jgi:hypothetical protein